MKKLLKAIFVGFLGTSFSFGSVACKSYPNYKLPPIDDAKYTNRFHVQNPTTGMMNDIQGGFFRDNKWHIYFLQNADGIFDPSGYNHGKFGSVWYHVTTTDWINWKYEGPAVPKYTTKYGDQASGTFFEDVNNDFGYGSKAIIAVTTSYSDEGQNIMMFYSIDGGYKFDPVKEEPILWNLHKKTNENFRDPYFFKKDNKFIMYIAEENEFGVYVSNKPTSGFEKTGSFKADHPMLECPNLFQMNVSNNECAKKWVAIYGGNGEWGDNADGLSTGTYYITGTLDENTYIFKPDEDQTYKRIDFGPDFYAAKFVTKSSSNVDLDSLIATAWVSNWNYNFSVPNDGRLGNMSLARELKLVNQGSIEKPVYYINSSYLGFDDYKVTKEGEYSNDSDLIEKENLAGQFYKLDLLFDNLKSTEDKINLYIGDEQYDVNVIIDFLNNKIAVTRSINQDFHFGKEAFEKQRVFDINRENVNDKSILEIYNDKTILEFKFLDGSTFTMLKYPDGVTKEKVKLTSEKESINYKYYQIVQD
ncbi:glycoside hydrolase family 32 protein [Spiroplasma tabanidicola]|uniref:Levanbiose-producing levanase n=1 Tax=Spiroplasma tabanidicola TaxID=324079 RepID=A0A6I6CB60_9MOLU|nr:glycoside hydrolase family 32 protein [Spiroplasma tabanidicola]QGS52175.1 levanbiose-producing levanase [Spiroplasma tabanidicola]